MDKTINRFGLSTDAKPIRYVNFISKKLKIKSFRSSAYDAVTQTIFLGEMDNSSTSRSTTILACDCRTGAIKGRRLRRASVARQLTPARTHHESTIHVLSLCTVARSEQLYLLSSGAASQGQVQIFTYGGSFHRFHVST